MARVTDWAFLQPVQSKMKIAFRVVLTNSARLHTPLKFAPWDQSPRAQSSVGATFCHLGRIVAAIVAVSCFVRTAAAQQAETVRGQVVTDAGVPLAGATVIVTRGPDRLSLSTVTQQDGAYSIRFAAGTGDYLVYVSASGRVPFRLRVRRSGPDSVLVANASLAMEAPASLAAVRIKAERVVHPARDMDFGGDVGSANSPVSGFSAAVTPDRAGDIAAHLAAIPGVVLTRDGASFLGLPAAQNSTTLDGMSFAGATMPSEAQARIRVGTSVYDPSRGDFSGAETSVEISPGSWLTTNTMHAMASTSPSLGNSLRQGSGAGLGYLGLGIGKSGEFGTRALFYRTAVDVSFRPTSSMSLFDISPQAARYAGFPLDSLRRWQTLIRGLGSQPLSIQRADDQGSFVLRVDNSPSAKVALSETGYLALGRSTGLGVSQMAAPSVSSTARNFVAFAGINRSEYFNSGLTLNETRLGINVSDNGLSPDVNLPSGTVSVSSPSRGQGNVAQQIDFGGSQFRSQASRETVVELRNETTRTGADGTHTQKATVGTSFDHLASQQANTLGIFTFNSLADLEQGAPNSYVRTLGGTIADLSAWKGFIALGDLWRVSNRLQILYGGRLDGSKALSAPRFNQLVLSQFGVRNHARPSEISASPRLGFRWVYSKGDENQGDRVSPLGTFYAQGPLAVIRGGVGKFSSSVSTREISPIFGNSGLQGSPQTLLCVGSATPLPDWSAYESGRTPPQTCADNASPTLQSLAPRVDVLDPAFSAPRSWRGNLGVTTHFGSWVVGIDGVHSLNLQQPSLIDLNFDPSIKFMTSNELRPMFISTRGIVPSAGSVSFVESRRASSFATVTEHGARGRSVTNALTVSLQPNFSSLGRGFVNVDYTLGYNSVSANGFTAPTFQNPLIVETSRGNLDIRHQFLLEAGYALPKGVTASLVAHAYSGAPFTPMVASDVNGDGSTNDRAFIFDPTTSTSPQFAQAMSDELHTRTGRIRECLVRQLGRAAARNSCTGPWMAILDAEISGPGTLLRLGKNARISLTFANPLAGLDELLHGLNSLRGWGSPAAPDPVLYTVKSYDSGTNQFVYEVNSRFGLSDRTRSTNLAPFRVTLNVSLNLAASYDKQQLVHVLTTMHRSRPGDTAAVSSIRRRYARTVPDPYELLLRFTDSLLLSRAQETQLREQDRRYRIGIDSIWEQLAATIVQLPKSYDATPVLANVVSATDSVWARTKEEYALVRKSLSALQWQLAPGIVKLILDPASHIRFQPQ